MPVEDHHFMKRLLNYSNARLSGWGKILVTAAFLGAGAASPGTYISAYLLPSFLLALLITAMIYSYFFKPLHASARRILTKPPAAGSFYTYNVLIKNNSKKPLRNISVVESTLPYGLYAAGNHADFRNTIDWLEPGEEQKVSLVLRTPRRGTFELGDLLIGSSFPLGITRKPVRMAAKDEFIVYPKIIRPQRVHLQAKRLYQAGGVNESSKVGDSNEFLSTREYRYGDRPRDVHWPSSARAGKLIVKEYIEEYIVRAALILDTHWARGARPDDFETRVSLCAGIADTLEKTNCILDTYTTDETIPMVTIGSSMDNIEHLLDTLSCIEGDTLVDFEKLYAQIHGQLPHYSSLVILLDDWDPARREFIERVKNEGHHVRVIIVRSRPCTLKFDDTVTVCAPKDAERLII